MEIMNKQYITGYYTVWTLCYCRTIFSYRRFGRICRSYLRARA